MKLSELKNIVRVFSEEYSDNDEIFAMYNEESETFKLIPQDTIIYYANSNSIDEEITDVNSAIMSLIEEKDNIHFLA